MAGGHYERARGCCKETRGCCEGTRGHCEARGCCKGAKGCYKGTTGGHYERAGGCCQGCRDCRGHWGNSRCYRELWGIAGCRFVCSDIQIGKWGVWWTGVVGARFLSVLGGRQGVRCDGGIVMFGVW